MKRLLVIGCAALAGFLALHRPPSAPAVLTAAAAPSAPPSQHSRKWHPSASAAPASIVYVVGAVARPGLYRVPANARIDDAVRRAGGLRADADHAGVNLAPRVTDGEEIDVLRTGETRAPASRRTKRKKTSHTAVSALFAGRLDLNAAGEAALANIPGIGATLAARIVAYRRLNGPFQSLDELADVAGMTQRRIDAVAAYAEITAK